MNKEGYLNQGFTYLANLIIAIIPITSWLFGVVTRIMRKHYIAALLELIPPITFIFWILDIVSIVNEKDLKFYA